MNEKAWQDFLSELNQRVGRETKLEDFKEELGSTVMKFGEPFLIGTGLDEKARKELLEKMISLREPKQKTEANLYKDSSTLNEKIDNNGIRVGMDDKNKTSNVIQKINILKAREEGQRESEKQYLDKEVESVMIVTTPPSKGVRSRKKKRETKELSPTADAVSEKNLKDTAPMTLAR